MGKLDIRYLRLDVWSSRFKVQGSKQACLPQVGSRFKVQGSRFIAREERPWLVRLRHGNLPVILDYQSLVVGCQLPDHP